MSRTIHRKALTVKAVNALRCSHHGPVAGNSTLHLLAESCLARKINLIRGKGSTGG